MVTGTITGPLSFLPARVAFPDRPKDAVTREVLITANRARTIAFTVRSKPEALQIKISPDKTASSGQSRYRLGVTMPPGTTSPFRFGTIVLATDHPEEPTLTIPVSFMRPQSDRSKAITKQMVDRLNATQSDQSKKTARPATAKIKP
jgi:hypothetical protein